MDLGELESLGFSSPRAHPDRGRELDLRGRPRASRCTSARSALVEREGALGRRSARPAVRGRVARRAALRLAARAGSIQRMVVARRLRASSSS